MKHFATLQKMKRQTFTLEEGLAKAKKYCAYQERCSSEVRTKLHVWGLSERECEWIICELITQDYMHELRFACLFVEGKSRIKGWGKHKIKHALQVKQISDVCIQKAINTIEKADYEQTIRKQADKWLRIHPSLSVNEQKQKLIRYLLTKGYEYTIIQEFIDTNIERE